MMLKLFDFALLDVFGVSGALLRAPESQKETALVSKWHLSAC